MSENWLSDFEQKFEVLLFKNDEKGISYFERKNSYQWFIKINQNTKTISTPRIIPNSFNERGKKEKEIVDCLLENIGNWEMIGLSNSYGEFEVQKLETSNNNNIFYYSEKESLNAFGGKSWEEF